MGDVDRRNKLGDEPFAYRTSRDGKVFVTWHGRHVTTLVGEAAAQFLTRTAGADAADAQLVMAKVTGNFKRGNER